jgi:Spy/CpxP family protein refolding chaperone
MRFTRPTLVRVSAAGAVLAIAGVVWLALPVVRASQQGPSGGYRWWQTQKQELSLTDDQSARIDTIFQSAVPKQRELFKELDRLEDQLSKMIADGSAEETVVLQQVDRVETARSALAKARTLMLYRMRQVLNPEQRKKLAALHEHQKQRERNGKNDRPKGGRGR